MATSLPEKADTLGRKHNNRFWAEKRRVTRGAGSATAATKGKSGAVATADHSKAIWRPGVPANVIVPVAGAVLLNLPNWENGFLTPLYHQHVGTGWGAWTEDSNYHMGISILCGLAAGATAIMGVEVWINGVPYQEVIRSTIVPDDLRYNGETAIHVIADPSDLVELYLTDPAGTGYSINVTEAFCDFDLGNRR